MFDAQKMFKERLTLYLKDVNRYLKYIFNGHMTIAMVFFIVVLSIYYQQWLEQLPEQFPSSWVIAFVLSFIVMFNPIYTFLKKADLVFLLPAEYKMETYFLSSLLFSYFQSSFLSLFIMAGLSPLYFHVYEERSIKYFIFLLVIVYMVKLINMIAQWWLQKAREVRMQQIEQLLRFLLNGAFFYFILIEEIFFGMVIAIIISTVFTYYYFLSKKHYKYPWESLIENDQLKMQFFYRFANLFTDVPHVQKTVKKRNLLTFLIKRIPFKQENTFDYLYRITFIRSGEYFNLFIRLTIVGGLFIYFIPQLWIQFLIALFFFYLTTFQLVSLYYHHRMNFLIDLYQVNKNRRKTAVMKWLFYLGTLQSIVFSFLFLMRSLYLFSLLLLISGVFFHWVFTKLYVAKKLT